MENLTTGAVFISGLVWLFWLARDIYMGIVKKDWDGWAWGLTVVIVAAALVIGVAIVAGTILSRLFVYVR